MGAKYAVTGGKEGWIRTVLTAVGVGLGVALLLFTTGLPGALDARDQRGRDRMIAETAERKGPDTLLTREENTLFRDHSISGTVLRPEGPDAPLPPGVARFPGPGEMLVSPALAALLDSPDGKELLVPRIPYKRVGTISDAGLIGPVDLVFYAGSDDIEGFAEVRVTAFGDKSPAAPWDPILLLLITVIFVVLLTPVAVFIATAVRFGGERRDRRLAALRLVGADAGTTRRIAAGEAAAGALFGVFVGLAFFLGVRQLVDDVDLGIPTRFFPSDFAVNPALALLVVLAVPAAAIVVTLLAMRGVVVEPLGVVRTAKAAKRRLWWRLILPLAGLAMLYPMIGQGSDRGEFSEWMVTAGVLLLLVGVTALLPWLVEMVVRRLHGGPVAWQLAVRRLQMSSGAATRPVNGIAVAVAGAIALQTLFTGVQDDFTKDTGKDTSRAQLAALIPQHIDNARLPEITKTISEAKGVKKVTTLGSVEAAPADDPQEGYISLTVGDCAALAWVAKLDKCSDGDLFLLPPDNADDTSGSEVKAGQEVLITPTGNESDEPVKPVRWTVPADTKTVAARLDPNGQLLTGIVATPGALRNIETGSLNYHAYITLDLKVPDVQEHARNAIFKADPSLYAMRIMDISTNDRFAAVARGLVAGSAAVMILIGISLLVSQLEQLRERKKLLAALVAFGTRRRTLGLSVLWQTAIPIALGITLATATGLALGTVLLKMVKEPVRFDWAAIGVMAGVGTGVVVLVTALSMPPLWRMMRPEGLRTE
nr:FtsX-like permease family protein [Streptomyces cavernae]